MEVAVRGSRAASELAKRAAAQREFLATGDDTKLRKLSKTKILDASGREVPFLTDWMSSSARATSERFPLRASTRGVADARARSDRGLATQPRAPSAASAGRRRARLRRGAPVCADFRSVPPCCFRCERLAQGREPYEDNHVFGKRNSPLTIRYPINDHRAVFSVAQYRWPPGALENPNGSVLLRGRAHARAYDNVEHMLAENRDFAASSPTSTSC